MKLVDKGDTTISKMLLGKQWIRRRKNTVILLQKVAIKKATVRDMQEFIKFVQNNPNKTAEPIMVSKVINSEKFINYRIETMI